MFPTIVKNPETQFYFIQGKGAFHLGTCRHNNRENEVFCFHYFDQNAYAVSWSKNILAEIKAMLLKLSAEKCS